MVYWLDVLFFATILGRKQVFTELRGVGEYKIKKDVNNFEFIIYLIQHEKSQEKNDNNNPTFMCRSQTTKLYTYLFNDVIICWKARQKNNKNDRIDLKWLHFMVKMLNSTETSSIHSNKNFQ